MDCIVRKIMSSALPRETEDVWLLPPTELEDAVSPPVEPSEENDVSSIGVCWPSVLTSVVSESVPTSVDVEPLSTGGGVLSLVL